MAKGTVLITGSGKGLGRNLALEFATKKYDVIINDRNKEVLDSVEREIKNEYGVSAYCVQGSINSEDTLKSLEHIAESSNLDILVNNAGVYLNKKFSETSDEEFRRVMETDFFAHARLTRKILPLFANKKGLIVNINSIAGLTGSYGESAYAAAKHALKGFSEALRADLIKDETKIINVYLGGMQTEMAKNAGRHSIPLLIDPKEAARFIVQTCEFCREASSVYLREIYLGRSNYAQK